MSSPARPPEPAPRPARSVRSLAVWVCLLAALVYLLTYSGVLHAVDEQSALSVAESMLWGQGFHANQMAWDQARTPPQNAFGPDGNLYSKKGIGVSLAALPLFGLGKLLAPGVGAAQVALLTGMLLAVLSVWAFFWLAIRLGYRGRTAALGALLLALGSPLWPYARTLFSETPGAAGLALALWGVVAWRRTAPAQAMRGAGWLLLAGCGLALLIGVKSSNAVVVPLFGAYWLWGVWEQTRTRRAGYGLWAGAAALALPVLLAVAGTVAYNYVRFGTTFGFPLEPFETFSTPLLVGLAGLLFSPGKGIFWYFPALWLGVAFIPHWRRGGRLPDFLLAAGAASVLIVVYALWYDWPGGRAWGPRMIITAVPALAMIVLPALDWLVGGHVGVQHGHEGVQHGHEGVQHGHEGVQHGHEGVPEPHVGVRTVQGIGRSFAIALLLLSFAVQIPGVLVNFERQEELDMQAGAAFDQLLWSPLHSPLLTYWARIPTTPDPLWLQPYLRTPAEGARATALLTLALLCVLAAVAGLVTAARRIRAGQGARRPLILAGAALLLLPALLPTLGRADPRWDEQSAVREDNAAMLHSIQSEYRPGDLVLLDLLRSSDKGRRTGQWLNFADQPYIGWLRADAAAMDGAAGDRLTAWLAPYRRVWLLLQATDEGDPASATEAWLNRWAYSGRRWWVGDQRAVEYLLPLPPTADAADAARSEVTGPFDFGGAAALQSYTLSEDGGGVRLLLRWADVSGPDLRYSVQALGSGGVLAQVDGIPNVTGGAAGEDRIGLALPLGVERLILKLYRAADGGVLPVTGPGQPPAEFLPLALKQLGQD